MPFIKDKNYCAVKLESTPGTAVSVAAADFNTRLKGISFEPEIEAFALDFASGRHSQAQMPMGKRKCRVKCQYAMATGSTVATPPNASKLFQICGAQETIVAATSVAWTPVATKDEISGTIVFYMTPETGNSVLITIKGAMGNCVIKMDDLGQPLVAEFDFLGAFVSVTDATGIALTSPDTGLPPAVIGVAVSEAGVVQKIGKYELDFGNTVELDYDPADATGYISAYIATRHPKINIDPRMELLANDAVYTRWSASTQGIVSIASSAVAGIKWTVTAPKAQLVTVKPGDRNGAMTWEQELQLQENAGNDQWQILQSA